MVSDKMAEGLIDQVNAELYSAYMYLAMSSYAKFKAWNGTANWFFAQAQEEVGHAHKIYGYLNSQGRHVPMKAIAEPPAEYESIKATFEAALKHEQKVTGLLNRLANQARAEKDHATEIFLQWFISEQVEEEENATEILAKLEFAGDRGPGVFMIDRELGMRKAG